MEQLSTSIRVMEAANHSKKNAMEAENHVKHEASAKNQMSRGGFLKACFALSLAPATLMMGCGGSGSGSGSSGGRSSGKIKMTTESDKTGFYLSGSGVATVDWGDGSEKVTLTLNENNKPYSVKFEHTYPNSSIRTITVNGDNITGLVGGGTSLDVSRCTELTDLIFRGIKSLDVSKNTALTMLICGNELTSLDLRNNTALTYLDCEYNQLTNLDLSKNIALTMLRCGSNPLTAVALNALFGTLHNNTVPPAKGSEIAKMISTTYNPGSDTCDRSIAERKGWTVY